MNNENECGSAKHCNLIPPFCGDTLISDSQFSISILKGRGLMDTARSIVHSVTHYIKNTDLYLMLLGLVCSIYGMLLIYSGTPQSGDGAGRLDEKPVCTGCRDHSRSGGVCRA